MGELTYETYRSRKPKPGPTASARAKRGRAEARIVKSVRAQCVERDGYCRLSGVGDCFGRSEWAHLGNQRRARTRGMAPESRHSTSWSLMLCASHHDDYDAHVFHLLGDANRPLQMIDGVQTRIV